MRVGFIGAGHIAGALAEGWARPEAAGAPALSFYDIDATRAEQLALASGGTAASSVDRLAAESDLVLLAVRPQHVPDVLARHGQTLAARPLVSLAAGVRVAALVAGLPPHAAVGRVMPNIGAAVGLGVFLLAAGTLGPHETTVREVFSLAGLVVPLDEAQFDAGTAIAGCMPGVLAHLLAAFAAAGEAHGLEHHAALRLAVAGAHGSAVVIARDGDPEGTVSAVATPGGMTAAAVAELEAGGAAALVHAAVEAAVRRAGELG
jgi:pyrroline-5-carboxylate reductase